MLPDLNIGLTLAIFRLSGNSPCWIETLKTWNKIFLKLSYASIIMLLLKSAALFVLNFWMLPQICQSLIPQTAFFFYSLKYITSMTTLKYDDVIKKVAWRWLLFWYFLIFFERSYVVLHSCLNSGLYKKEIQLNL